MRYLYALFILLTMASIFFAPADRHELNELSFTFAMGIDEAKDGYELSLQLINPAAIAGKTPIQNSPYIVYKATGKTIDSAFERISVNLSRFVHLRQVEIIIIGEKLARKGRINEIAEYVLHSSQVPTNTHIVIAKAVSPSDLLKVYSPVEGFSAFEISNTIKKIGKDIPKTSSEIKVDMVKEGKDFALPFIQLKGNLKKGITKGNFETTSPAHIAYGGLALFKGNQLTAFIEYREAAFLSLLQGSAAGYSIESSCPKEKKDYFVYRVFSNFANDGKVEVHKNQYIFHYDLRLKGDISQYQCGLNLEDPKQIEQLEKQLKKTIQIKVHDLLTLAQKNELDPLGLGLMLSEQRPKEWKKLKEDWPAHLKNAEIKLNTKVSINSIGNYKSRGD